MTNTGNSHAAALAKIHNKRSRGRPYWLFSRNGAWRTTIQAEAGAAKAGLSDDDLHMIDDQRRNMDMRELEAVLHEGA